MRKYGKVTPAFWTGETGRSLRGDANAQRVALYLLTCPSANMIGLYYLPLPVLQHEIGLSRQGALKALRRVSEVGFAEYDDVTEHVWVPEMACYQIGESLKADDNRRIAILKQLEEYSKCKYSNDFIDKYGGSYHLYSAANPKPLQSPFGDPSETLRSQREGTVAVSVSSEKEQETSKEPPKPPARSRSLKVSPIGFEEFWRSYPRKVGKQAALRAWKKINPGQATADIIIEAIRNQTAQHHFQNGKGEDFIPNPATWLNQGRWDDEIAPPPETPEQRKERELDEHQAKRRKRWAAEAKENPHDR